MYMSSQCTNDGAYTLTVTFRRGRPQPRPGSGENRVSLAQQSCRPRQTPRVTVKKKSPSILMIINLFSTTILATIFI